MDSTAESSKYSKKDLELKKIRHEVVKFGMSGFDANKKQEAKIALAVSLGAKPPRKPYINYKELMQKRKEEKIQDTADRQQMISKSIMHKTGQKKKKTVNNDVGHFLSPEKGFEEKGNRQEAQEKKETNCLR
ncbi:Uncharacterized protein OBRU01_14943 [Operophtera brumata]|uniref:Uncharacterized protein n=1 Tax=Operophtera brumata TaxID=104452 RepID=A0A0L7L5W1_OPEBR|nr:Uncharacterized protein OBRU01_14943 [Operophtera brumata]